MEHGIAVNEPGGRRLLVVDDEHIERMLVAHAAAPLGFTVDAASNLEEAALLLSQHVYDAIVLDLALGETESISLLPGVASRGERPRRHLRLRHGRPGARRQRPAGRNARPAGGGRTGQAGRPRRVARPTAQHAANAPHRLPCAGDQPADRGGTRAGAGAGGARRSFPAEGRAALRRGHRCGGARPLASTGRLGPAARPVHPAGRGDRPDRAADRGRSCSSPSPPAGDGSCAIRPAASR